MTVLPTRTIVVDRDVQHDRKLEAAELRDSMTGAAHSSSTWCRPRVLVRRVCWKRRRALGQHAPNGGFGRRYCDPA